MANPQELIDLSSNHDDIWFQRVNLEDGSYIWALSVEHDDDNSSTSESSDLVVDMNGSVYEGDFYEYWWDKFEIDVNNSSNNWTENSFDANESGVRELYLNHPEIKGANAQFDFTIINQIDLANPQELIDLSSNHDDIWFQRVNLEDGSYIWALSVEHDDDNSSTSESSDLMVDMNGSVYEGDFHGYWWDKFEIDVDNNSSSNWTEDSFDANESGVSELYLNHPEIKGANAQFDFTIINQIDLANPQELIDLSSNHDDIWFQRVNLEDGSYIWALSVEHDDDNSSTSESSDLVVDMNGSVYEGDFYEYWWDKFEIDVDNNSSSNWTEDSFDANESGVSELFLNHPEIKGANAQFDFTIINQIDLANPQELIDLSSNHDDIWFQRVNLEDGSYIWALSVEHDDDNSSTSESSDLVCRYERFSI